MRAIPSVLVWYVSLVAVASASLVPAFGQTKPPENRRKPEPMRVEIIRDATEGCEPKCAEWISAEGDITADTPARFAAVFRKIGNRDIPVLVSSFGGSIEGALAVGRMLRTRKARVVIARTAFHGCAPKEGPACLKSKKQKGYAGRPGEGGLRAVCASACPFLLAGGQDRLASSTALIGVHQVINFVTPTRQLYRIQYRIVNGQKREISRTLISETRGKTQRRVLNSENPVYAKMRTHLVRMGVASDVVDLALKAGPEDMNWLRDQEMVTSKLLTSRLGHGQVAGLTGAMASPGNDNAMRTRPSQTPLPSIYEQASQRANTPNQAPGTAQNDGLAHLEFALGKHGSTFLGIGIDFQSNRQDRLIDIIVMATLDGVNLRGGMPSALLEIEGGKAVLARRLNGAPPFAPLRASITPADFCRIVRGQKLAIAFERPADGAEAAIDARLAPTSVEISGPAAKAICT